MSRVKNKNNGPAIRFYACLLDRKKHLVSEFYDWISESISPQVAIREFKRENKLEEFPYETMVVEGRRKSILSALRTLTYKGIAEVIFPEKQLDLNITDPKDCIVSLTDKGYEHIIEGAGTFNKVLQELQSGIKAKRILVSFNYTGNFCET